MKKRTSFAIMLFVCCCTGWLYAQTPEPTLVPTAEGSWYQTFNIFVYDADSVSHEPIPGATVTMRDRTSATIITGNNGEGSLTILLHDTTGVSYTVSAPGYETLFDGHYSLYFPSPDIEFGLRAEGNPYYELRFEPGNLSVESNDYFTLDLYLTTTFFSLAHYEFEITWGPANIFLDTSQGIGGVVPAFDGVFNSVNPDLDTLYISGPESWIGPGVDIHLFTIHFFAGENQEKAEINLNILNKEGPYGYPMPRLNIPEPVVVTLGSPGSDQQAGDVNDDGVVDIIDALLIAQFYVGIDMSETAFDPLFGDVNTDGTVDIVDALLVALYYVELIPALPVE